MKPFLEIKATCIVLLFLFSFQCNFKSQGLDGSANYYAMGAVMDIPKGNLAVYYGVSPDDNLKALAVLPIFKLHDRFHFMAGYFNVNIDLPDGKSVIENHFAPSLIFNLPVAKKLVFTNRHMYFHRDIPNEKDVHIYRNRFGLSYFPKVFGKKSRMFVHNALFVSLDNGRMLKNRLLFGFDYEITNWMVPQFWYVIESFQHHKPRNMYYILFTVPLNNFGVFGGKKKTQQR